jgi:hypothetical protein
MPSGGARPGSGRPRKEPKPTERVKFTEEEMTELKKSPHVVQVTEKTVSYTLAFKNLVWDQYTAGEMPDRIFMSNGLNPEILGTTRIYGLITLLRHQKEQELLFKEGRTPHKDETSESEFDIPKLRSSGYKKKTPYIVADDDIQRLFHKVAYLSQEMEFLKKIILLGKDGK